MFFSYTKWCLYSVLFGDNFSKDMWKESVQTFKTSFKNRFQCRKYRKGGSHRDTNLTNK